LSCIGKRTKEGCNHGSKDNSQRARQGRASSSEDPKDLKKRVVRKVLSPGSIVGNGMPYFSMTGASRLGRWVKGSVALVLVSESAIITGKYNMNGDPLEA